MLMQAVADAGSINSKSSNDCLDDAAHNRADRQITAVERQESHDNLQRATCFILGHVPICASTFYGLDSDKPLHWHRMVSAASNSLAIS